MIITILSFAFVLGVLVFVHELGHFMAAKRVGIRVLKFQLGFNPTVLSFRRGDTEYGLGLVPLGGYVKMAGDSPDETRTGGADEFLSKTKWERFQVLIMGPVMNLLLAFLALAVVIYNSNEVPAFLDMNPEVGSVAPGSPAAAAGIVPGDLIEVVGDVRVDTWEKFYDVVSRRANRETSIALRRKGLEVSLTLTPVPPPGQKSADIGDIGVLPNVHPHIRSVNRGKRADEAGLKANDVVLAIDNEPINVRSQLKEVISKHPEQTITLSIQRDGAVMSIQAKPELSGNEGLLGISIGDQVKVMKPSVLGALGLSLRKNVEYAGLIFQTVWGLFTRQTSPKQLMGPLAIAELSGESARLGFVALLNLMASISLNLGLLNLMPIPVLDGGHILILAVEGVARRDFSKSVKEKMLFAGLMVLMMLMVTVLYNDLTRMPWIQHLMPWR